MSKLEAASSISPTANFFAPQANPRKFISTVPPFIQPKPARAPSTTNHKHDHNLQTESHVGLPLGTIHRFPIVPPPPPDKSKGQGRFQLSFVLHGASRV